MKAAAWIFAAFMLVAAGGAAWWMWLTVHGRSSAVAAIGDAPLPPAAGGRSAERSGSVFLPTPDTAFGAPTVRALTLPAVAGGNSVWGAFGRDHRGHIYVGVSVGDAGASPHLLDYDPRADVWRDRGNAIDELRRLKLLHDGESQVKLHSRIVEAADGLLYFSTFDEAGEDQHSMSLPRWGGHLWRMQPADGQWEHLLSTKEALIAVGTTGRNVYALGYFDHVLHVYDTETGTARSTPIGAAGGHVSRNLIVGSDEHAFVTRVVADANGSYRGELVELDHTLTELAAHPLADYPGTEKPASHHGIVAAAYLADDRLVFTTHSGQLYLILPTPGSAATVKALGWFHPDGAAYAPSLFAFSGETLAAGVAKRDKGEFEWVVHNIETGLSGAFALDTGELPKLLLYGSITRDDLGRFYVGGWSDNRPVVLQIDAGNCAR